MPVKFDVTDPCGGAYPDQVRGLKGMLARDEDFARAAVETLVQAAFDAEMTETRLAYRSGYTAGRS